MKEPEIKRLVRTALLHLAANADVDEFGLCLNALFRSDESQEAGQPFQRKYELMKTLYTMAQETPFKREREHDSWIRQQARTIKMLWEKSLHRVPV